MALVGAAAALADLAAALAATAAALAWADMANGESIGVMEAKVVGMGGSGGLWRRCAEAGGAKSPPGLKIVKGHGFGWGCKCQI